MKLNRAIVSVLLCASLLTFSAAASAKGSGHSGGHSKGGDVHVHGYTKKDGTYVAPHERSAPNGTKSDNWSTKGNVNPYTGKEGTKNPN